jgi:hypothetical protein
MLTLLLELPKKVLLMGALSGRVSAASYLLQDRQKVAKLRMDAKKTMCRIFNWIGKRCAKIFVLLELEIRTTWVSE